MITPRGLESNKFIITFIALIAIATSRDVRLSELFDGISQKDDMVAISNFSDSSSIQKLNMTPKATNLSLPYQFNALKEDTYFGFYFYFGFTDAKLTYLQFKKDQAYYKLECNRTLDGSSRSFSYLPDFLTIERDLTYQWCVIKFSDQGIYEYMQIQVIPLLYRSFEIHDNYEFAVNNCSLPSCKKNFTNIFTPTIINFKAHIDQKLSLTLDCGFQRTNNLNLSYIVYLGNLKAKIYQLDFQRTDKIPDQEQFNIQVKAKDTSEYIFARTKYKVILDQELDSSYVIFCITCKPYEPNAVNENQHIINITARLRPHYKNDTITYDPIKNPFTLSPFQQKMPILATNIPKFTQIVVIKQSSQLYQNPSQNLVLQIKQAEYMNGQPDYQNTTFLVLLGYVPLRLLKTIVESNSIDQDSIDVQYSVRAGVSKILDGRNITNEPIQDMDLIENTDLLDNFVYLYISSLNLTPYGLRQLSLTFKFSNFSTYHDLKLNAFKDCQFGSCSSLAAFNFSGDVGVFWITINETQFQTEYPVPQAIGRDYTYYAFYVGFQNVTLTNMQSYSYPCKCIKNRILTQQDMASMNEFGCNNINLNLQYSFFGYICKVQKSMRITVGINLPSKKNQLKLNCPSGSFVTASCQSKCVELTKNVQQQYSSVVGYNSNNCFKIGSVKKSTFIVQAVNVEKPVKLYHICIPSKSKQDRYVFTQTQFDGILTFENKFTDCNLIFWSRQNLYVGFYDYSTNKPAPLPFYNQCQNIQQCFSQGNKNQFTNIMSSSNIVNISNTGTNYFKISPTLISKLKKTETNITIIQLSKIKYNLLIQYSNVRSISPINTITLDPIVGQKSFKLKTAQLKNYIFGLTYDPLSLLDKITIGIRLN